MNEERSQEKIRKVRRDPAWLAVFRIFERFDGDERIWAHVDLEREGINFEEMLDDGTFSGGERRMIKIAASLFNQDYEINLWSVLGNLDEENSAVVVKALEDFLGLS